MPDVFTKAKRSEVMSRIRSRGNTDTELALAKLFRANGIKGWRRHIVIRGRAVLPRGPYIPSSAQSARRKDGAAQQHRPTFRVRPDFVFWKVKLAVFVDGCFWHGCPKHCNQPANNREFWRRKLSANKTRDALVTRTLRRSGWRVLRIWEHELADLKASSAAQPKPSPPAPLPSDGRGWRRALPVRGGEGAEARLLRRIQGALEA